MVRIEDGEPRGKEDSDRAIRGKSLGLCIGDRFPLLLKMEAKSEQVLPVQ